MSYTSELRNRLCKVVADQLPAGTARTCLIGDLDYVREMEGNLDGSQLPISPESRIVYLKIAELALMLSTMADRAELRELRSKVRPHRGYQQQTSGPDGHLRPQTYNGMRNDI